VTNLEDHVVEPIVVHQQEGDPTILHRAAGSPRVVSSWDQAFQVARKVLQVDSQGVVAIPVGLLDMAGENLVEELLEVVPT